MADIDEGYSKKINFILAISAILISLASFYVAYVQARSAEQQVKAMTYPLVQFSTGNYNKERKQREIEFRLTNNGVGPAIIKQLEYEYKNKYYQNFDEFIKACCSEVFKQFNSSDNASALTAEALLVTSYEIGIIIPAAETYNIVSLMRHSSNENLWEKINQERRELAVSVCYCSLLDNCYIAKQGAELKEVDSCSTENI